jgi:hypothetical protein
VVLEQTKNYETPVVEAEKLDVPKGMKADDDVVLQQTRKYDKPIEDTGKLDVPEDIKADNDVAKRVKAPEFPAFGL